MGRRFEAVAFREKLQIIHHRLGKDRASFQLHLDDFDVIRPSESDRWFDQANPVIQRRVRERLITYLNDIQKIPFTDECFGMSLEQFERHLSGQIVSPDQPTQPAVQPAADPPAVGMDRFVGTFQVIRPHTFLSDRYILEAMGVAVEGDVAKQFMYSHNHLQGTEYLYEGQAYFSSRYCSSLLIRRHEQYPMQTASRSTILYIGQSALSDRLSGLLLRGVTGHVGGDQAVALPFIALRETGNRSLRRPDFLLGKLEGLYRLHKDGHVLVGVIDNRNSTKELFGWCQSVFGAIKELEIGIVYGNSVVLHTVAPGDLRRIDSLDFKSWAELVDKFIATNFETRVAEAKPTQKKRPRRSAA